MNKRWTVGTIILLVFFAASAVSAQHAPGKQPRIRFEQDTDDGKMSVIIDGKLAFGYQYRKDLDLPHFYPVNSPSGKEMIVEQTEPYPHHRGFWFADKIKFDGKVADLYNALYSGTGGSRKPYKPYHAPFRQYIRHVEFMNEHSGRSKAKIEENLVWIIENDVPALDEHRVLNVRAMSDGAYFLDITYTLTASYGPVEFISDAVHYAWPYIRVNRRFSVEGGGTITNSEGGINQAGTHDKIARWVDYSNTVDGTTEGIAIFSHPSNGYPHKWLTRDYGCFGPRRPDERSGKPFTLKKGETISQRVGVLVHTGDVKDGAVAERYQRYVDGKL